MIKRAYSLLEIKSYDDEKRELTGIATTPSTDRYGDIVEPKGAEFELPLPFLWQHDARKPVGHVTKAKATQDGIEVTVNLKKPEADAPQSWADRLNEAWADIKSGLVRGLSIGFSPIEYSFIEETFGVRYLKWSWLELSGVTIPANGDCSIQTIKSIDTQLRLASGLEQKRVVQLSPGVSGLSAAKRGAIKLIPRKYENG